MNKTEFYNKQESINATKYTGNNLKRILRAINNGELKAPVTTFHKWNENNYKVVQKHIIAISKPEQDKNDENKINFSSQPVWGFNQVVKKENKENKEDS